MTARELDRLEQEVDRDRADLAHTLAEIEARLSPGHLVDEALSAVRLRDDGKRRRIELDGWSLAVVALAGAWLLWSQRRGGNGAEATLPRRPPQRRQASPAPAAPDAATCGTATATGPSTA